MLFLSHRLYTTPQYASGTANHSQSPGPMLILIEQKLLFSWWPGVLLPGTCSENREISCYKKQTRFCQYNTILYCLPHDLDWFLDYIAAFSISNCSNYTTMNPKSDIDSNQGYRMQWLCPSWNHYSSIFIKSEHKNNILKQTTLVTKCDRDSNKVPPKYW